MAPTPLEAVVDVHPSVALPPESTAGSVARHRTTLRNLGRRLARGPFYRKAPAG
jgi:hypothetical protein